MIQGAIAAIEGQQPKERSAVWMVGEQLKDMVRGNEAAAALLLTDLTQNKEMTLAAAEKKIAERAKKNKVGNCGCVTPAEAEDILREFFGLPEHGTAAAPQTERRKVVDLADLGESGGQAAVPAMRRPAKRRAGRYLRQRRARDRDNALQP